MSSKIVNLHTDTGRITESDLAPIPDAETIFQDAFNELPTDEILTLLWSMSLLYENLTDKKNAENIQVWKRRVDKALESKRQTKIKYGKD
jgi:hypothetical protein